MSARPRALFVALHFSKQGGLEIYNLDVARSLARLGFEVHAISALTEGDVVIDGIPVIGLGGNRPGPLARIRRQTWMHRVQRHIDTHANEYDLLLAGHLYTLPYVIPAAKRHNIPCWLFAFGIEIWTDLGEQLRKCMRECTDIISISRYTDSHVRRHLGGHAATRTHIISPSVDTHRFCPQQQTRTTTDLVVLTVARLSSQERYKGHELMFDALPRVLARIHRTLVYRVVGDGDDRPRLELLCRQRGLQDYVQFQGRVNDDRLVQAYNDCDLFVMPSAVQRRADGRLTGEGFGIVFIEAAACGKPVIGVNQGGTPDAVAHGENGLLVAPVVDELAAAIIALLQDDGLRQRMGERGRVIAQTQFSVPLFQQRVSALLAASRR